MNKTFIALIVLSTAALVSIAAMVIYLPAVWLAIVSAFILWGISFYLYVQLKRRTVEEFQKYNSKFIESGNAITDTLKVAFDNVKKSSRDLSQVQSSVTEHKAKIHRLEQHIARIKVQGMSLKDAFPEVNQKYSKTKQKNERRNQQAN